MRRYFPDADGPTLGLEVCLFTNTPDGHFVVDTHPDDANVTIADYRVDVLHDALCDYRGDRLQVVKLDVREPFVYAAILVVLLVWRRAKWRQRKHQPM